MPDASCEKSMHNTFMISTPSSQSLKTVIPYAVRFPLAFFLGVSAMVRPVEKNISAIIFNQLSFEEPLTVL
jgi:hypothetical protein